MVLGEGWGLLIIEGEIANEGKLSTSGAGPGAGSRQPVTARQESEWKMEGLASELLTKMR